MVYVRVSEESSPHFDTKQGSNARTGDEHFYLMYGKLSLAYEKYQETHELPPNAHHHIAEASITDLMGTCIPEGFLVPAKNSLYHRIIM